MSRLTVMNLAVCSLLLLTVPALAEVVPTSQLQNVGPLAAVARITLSPVDRDQAAQEDEVRALQGEPDRFAVPEEVSITPESHGTWEDLPDPRFVLWRLRLESPGSLSMNLGFDRFELPRGGRLVVHPAGGNELARQYTERDNRPHGQLWTPVILGDELVVELTLPAVSRHDYELRLVQVGKGYRFFGEEFGDQPGLKSGSCNNDVVCPEGDPWRAEINSVAVYTINGTWMCTGAMVNNTAGDGAPYFLTANHCGINAGNDASVVVFWNFQSPVCGQQGGGSLSDAQNGVIYRASSATSDFCLVEFEQMPDPDWNVTYAGWDRTDADPPSVVAIHHPSTDEKSISFEDDPTFTTSYVSTDSPGNGTHLRVVDWDDGTTEGGSSGSPLFSPGHHIVGQLHGGYAACGNDLSDWYGRFSVSWTGGGDDSSRLSNWLDPLGTAPMTVDLFDPAFAGLTVSPAAGLDAQGDVGGPFSPDSRQYTLQNSSDGNILYQVNTGVPWIDLSSTGGNLSPGATTTVTVSIGAGTASLPAGVYDGLVEFVNLTTGEGDTVRPVHLQVGTVATIYAWSLDSDPGWAREGQWQFGEPAGSGGIDHGNPDPAAGHTGANVLGYNLAGDYAAELPEFALTTEVIDCSDLLAVSLRFNRWLNVESPVYDHAYIRVSTDGASWTTIWQNGGEITDDSWQEVEFDLSALADGRETVQVRWVMGTTDDIWQYSGWNLDDIEIRGLRTGGTPAPDTPTVATRLHGAAPNPFNPRTDIRFTLARAGEVRLTIHDTRGRLVTVLSEEHLPAGDHTVSWGGTGAGGRKLGSGVYFARLVTEGGAQTSKVVLVK